MPDDCEPETCIVFYSHYGYRPSFLANVVFLILWVILAVFHLAEGIVLRQWIFSSLILLGCIMKAAGYAARLFSYEYPAKNIPYFVQVCLLTVAPTLFSAATYICLSDT